MKAIQSTLLGKPENNVLQILHDNFLISYKRLEEQKVFLTVRKELVSGYDICDDVRLTIAEDVRYG